MYRWLWPNREGWTAEYHVGKEMYVEDDLQRIIVKDNTRAWRSPDTQSKGNYLRVRIKKSGRLKRGRVIDAIQFDADSGNEIPERPYILFYRIHDNNWGYKREHLTANHGIVNECFPPIKIDGFGVKIIVLNYNLDGEPYHWKIHNFRLREVKLLGHFVKRWI